MAGYPNDSTIMVRPFSHRVDGDEATIADLEKEIYLTIPVGGLDILQNLAAGKTIGETLELYKAKYGDTPDIADFLDQLVMEGFLDPQQHSQVGSHYHRFRPGRLAWGMNWVPQSVARIFVSVPALLLYTAIVGWGLYLAFSDLSLVPGSEAMLFPHDFAVLTWMVIISAFTGLIIHEIAHMIAARAAGVPSRIGMGNRIFMIVAETDMTGIWLKPKRDRYIAILSGPVIDLISASALITLLWAHKQGHITLSSFWWLFVNGVMFTHVIRLMWQMFLFIRTDLYYVIITAFNANNLIGDTEDYLRNFVNRLRRARRHVIDQSIIPRKERLGVKVYSVVWLIGRFFAGIALITYTIPVLFGYYTQIFYLLTGQPTRFGSWDFFTVFILGIVLESLGLYLWIRSMWRAYQQRKRERLVREAKAAAALETAPSPSLAPQTT